MYIYTWSSKRGWKHWFRGWLWMLAQSPVKRKSRSSYHFSASPMSCPRRTFGRQNQEPSDTKNLSSEQPRTVRLSLEGTSIRKGTEPSLLWLSSRSPAHRLTFPLPNPPLPKERLIVSWQLGEPVLRKDLCSRLGFVTWLSFAIC